jgi:hypothetical protein
MADNTTLQLTDQQIELAKAFNDAADKFVELMRVEYETGELRERHDEGQSLSKIGTAATTHIQDILQANGISHLHAEQIIRGGPQTRMYDVENAETEVEQAEMLTYCRDSILSGLFLDAFSNKQFPKEIFTQKHPDFYVPDLPESVKRYL